MVWMNFLIIFLWTQCFFFLLITQSLEEFFVKTIFTAPLRTLDQLPRSPSFCAWPCKHEQSIHENMGTSSPSHAAHISTQKYTRVASFSFSLSGSEFFLCRNFFRSIPKSKCQSRARVYSPFSSQSVKKISLRLWLQDNGRKRERNTSEIQLNQRSRRRLFLRFFLFALRRKCQKIGVTELSIWHIHKTMAWFLPSRC